MKHIPSLATILIIGLSNVSSAFAVDPCEMGTVWSGGKLITTDDRQDLDNGFNYELWKNGKGGKMTVYGGDADCAFKAEWNNSNDYVARCGLFWGKEIENTPSYKDLDGDIHAEFSFTKTGKAYNYSFIGVYGWSKDPLVEFYISEDTYNSIDAPWNTEKIGSAEIDGAIYNFYKGTMLNNPSIFDDKKQFVQIFSIRQTKRQCGHISVSEHFKAWEKLGVKTGPLYDCKIVVETGGDIGSVDFHYATMWIGDENGPFEKEERAPFKDTIAIPGIVEAEDYDKGGFNVAYYDTDRKNEGEVYRNDGVDIVETPDGYAVGYSKTNEWLEYTINVDETDDYKVEAMMANGNAAPKISLIFDGKDTCLLTGKSVKNDWDTYSLAAGKVSLTEGPHTMRLLFNNNYTNIDYLKFTSWNLSSISNEIASNYDVIYDDKTIKVVSSDDVKQVRLISTTGMTILSENGNVLNIENANTGVYIVSAVTSNGMLNKKVNIVK
ncbi:MAG: glycoside hydrolase family 11 protein [Paludibacteraceae bacterium]|nr:glycoside hydrolase family 11 protein [Paludibacteraceae bacterium]